jgi:2-polyprenyl-3-methyl-5-hydroxy-6-metoxy-1,4-benzoquinol methylase
VSGGTARRVDRVRIRKEEITISNQDAAKYWNDQASEFDEQPDHGLKDPLVRRAWKELLLPLLPIEPVRIADIGCGTGSLSLLLAEAGHHVSGLDISSKMVEIARAKIAKAKLVADFIVADAANPPWQAGTFDVVMTRHVLWAMPDPEAVLSCWLKLLNPGGQLLLVEGRWWTGTGLSSHEVKRLVLKQRLEAEVVFLNDEALWGQSIRDERYLVRSRK